MFEKRDYWPFLVGVFAFGGFLILPALFQFLIAMGWFPKDDSYGMSMLLGLLFCAPFAYATDRETCEVNFGKVIVGFVLLNLLMLKSAFTGGGAVVLLGPGFIGLIVLYASGWAGVKIGRALGLDDAIEQMETNKQAERPGGDLVFRAERLGGDSVFRDGHMAKMLKASYRACMKGSLVSLSERLGSEETSWTNKVLATALDGDFNTVRALFGRVFSEDLPREHEYIMGYGFYGEGFLNKDKGILVTNYNVYLVDMKGEAAPTMSFPVEDIATFGRLNDDVSAHFFLTLKTGESIDLGDEIYEARAALESFAHCEDTEISRGDNDEILITYPALVENMHQAVLRGATHPSWPVEQLENIRRKKAAALLDALAVSKSFGELAKKTRKFEDGEYYVHSDLLGYLLTNLCCYFFAGQEMEDKCVAVLLRDIEKYERKGTLSFTVAITLKNAPDIHLKSINGAPRRKFMVEPTEKPEKSSQAA